MPTTTALPTAIIKRISPRLALASTLLVLIMAAPYNRRIRYHLKNSASVFCLALMSLWGVIIGLLFRLTGNWKNTQFFIARSYYFLVSHVTGIKCVVRNEQFLSTTPAIYICNHQSWMDILMIGRIFPRSCVVMSKKSLKYSPLLGQFMSLSGSVFVDRVNQKDALATFKQAASQVKDKQVGVFIFPEGTRSAFDEPDLLPFKKGAFHLAIQAGVPIVPICVANYTKLYSHKHMNFEKGRVDINVLEPIPTKDYTPATVQKLIDLARGRMLAEIKQMQAKQELSNPKANASHIARVETKDKQQ